MLIDNCAAVTHNKFEFDTRREEWFLKIRGSFCDDANLPSSSKPGPDLLSSKAPSECSRASNLNSKSSNVSSTSSRISMKCLRAREKLKLAQLEAAQLKEVIEEKRAQNEMKQKIRQKEASRKLKLANAQYEIWMEADVKTERDLEVKSRDPLGSSQLKSSLFKLNSFPQPLVTPFQVHHHSYLKAVQNVRPILLERQGVRTSLYHKVAE